MNYFHVIPLFRKCRPLRVQNGALDADVLHAMPLLLAERRFGV